MSRKHEYILELCYVCFHLCEEAHLSVNKLEKIMMLSY